MGDVALVIKRTFDASPEDVFEAWTDPAQVAVWYGPEGFTNEIHSFELKEGGQYSLTMNAPDGAKHKLKGVFKTIEKPTKLVFTWQWENEEMGRETIVTVELAAIGDKTEMIFTHSGFVNEQGKEMHNQGWTGSFNKLEKLFA